MRISGGKYKVTEMGLAVLQQTKQFEHGFEHGMLARAFDNAHNAFKETLKPLLRLVDVEHIEENLDNLKTKLSSVPNFLDLDENALDHDDHVKEAVFNYSTKDITATPSTHVEDNTNDRDITTIGYLKGSNANQAGLAIRKANMDSKTAFMLIAQQQMQQRAQDIAQQIERLQRQIRAIDEYKARNGHLTSDDFDANTAEGRKNREEAARVLRESGSDKTLDDFKKADGGFDAEGLNKHLDDVRITHGQKLDTLSDANRNALITNAQSDVGAETLEKYEVEANNLVTTTTDATSLESFFNADDLFAQTEDPSSPVAQENYVEVVQVASSQQGFGERSYSSAAAELDGKENCSVISMAFTQCAAGTSPQQVAAAPQPQQDLQQNQNASYSVSRLG